MYRFVSPRSRRPRASLLIAVTIWLIAAAGTQKYAAAAELAPSGYRLQQAVGKFGDTYEFAVEWDAGAPQWLRADRIAIAVGTLTDSSRSRAFVSAGPVWSRQFGVGGFAEFGFSPTLLSGSRIDGRDLGGNLHFASSIAVGRQFGDVGQYRVALRVQHLSNGGLNSANPGLDAVGLSVSMAFNGQ